MKDIDLTSRIKNWIKFGLIIPVAVAGVAGYSAFSRYHYVEDLTINDARVEGTLVSVRTLVNGTVSEVLFKNGDNIRAGEVLARLSVNATAEEMAQLETNLADAKQQYENLKLGQVVEVPVKTIRTIPGEYYAVERPSSGYYTGGVSSATLASLQERANRMEALFEMGAVSRVQRDSAVAEYESALASGGSYYVEEAGGVEYVQGEPTYVEEIEYVEQWQATPPEALKNAENAIKQAEYSLKVAQQEAQQTEVIAPVSGTIYYLEVDGEVSAGEVLAQIGDSSDLWLSAEVPEATFNKIPLGKPVDYVLAGYDLSGTVIEKIAPAEEEPVAQEPETATDDEKPPADKYIVRFSLPAERSFECKPNQTTNVKVRLF